MSMLSTGYRLTREQCNQALAWPDAELLSLVQDAYTVRRKHFGNRVHVQVLRNAKSGLCSEDCHYCSQSKVSRAEIEKYPMIAPDTLVAEARKTRAMGATRF